MLLYNFSPHKEERTAGKRLLAAEFEGRTRVRRTRRIANGDVIGPMTVITIIEHLASIEIHKVQEL